MRPDQVEVEIGVTLTAEAGAVVARTSAQGHLKVKLIWTSPVPALPSPAEDVAGAGAQENAAHDDRSAGRRPPAVLVEWSAEHR